MLAEVDSYRYVDPVTSRIIKAWVAREPEHEIPWTPLVKPLSQCRVALLTSAGLARPDQSPFDQQGERDNPWWGDPLLWATPRGFGTIWTNAEAFWQDDIVTYERSGGRAKLS